MNLAEFLEIAGNLKSTKRTGWVERGVGGAESVADHSFMMALMCVVLPAKGIDREKAMKMALVHDLAESITGDMITKESWQKRGTISRADKSRLEEKVLKTLLSKLDGRTAGDVMNLWKEFEGGKTKEAIFVRDLDTAEMIIQAHKYCKAGNFRKPLEGFWDGKNTGRIKNESIKMLVRKIINGS